MLRAVNPYPVTGQFEAETDLELLILLDATASMAWRWKESISKLEYGANLFAALAAMHIRQQDRVGFLMHDANDLHYLPPRGRKQQLDEIFAILTRVEPATTQTFPLLVQSLTENKHHRGRVVICSDLEEDEDQILNALESLAAIDDEVILFHILDYAEEIFMFENATHLQDAESGELLAINLEEMRKQHADNVRGFRDFWRLRCQDWNILYIPIHTGMNYAESIIGFGEERKLASQSGPGSG